MIKPNQQQTLFLTTKQDALILANTSESIANLWYNKNYLSFDISKVDELQNPQVLEITFISKLFKSTLDLDTINNLLLKLPKPYSYDYQQFYFNVFSNEWEYLPEEINEEEIANKYLESLSKKDNRDEIEKIIYNLKALLK